MLNYDAPDCFIKLFFLAFFFRYFRLVVNIGAVLRFKPQALPLAPAFTIEHVTFVIPTTFSNPQATMECLQRIRQCGPAAIIMVTATANKDLIRQACKRWGITNVQVLGVTKLNKRHQMLKGLEHVETDITFFVDDDVFFPSTDLPKHLLACFEDPLVGAAGPRQQTRRTHSPCSWTRAWNFLGISYLERRNFNTGATNFVDGGVSTLSGRTQAVRTAILKNDEFFDFFLNDSFMQRKLTADDDKALTRFIFARGWEIRLNFHDDCTIETTLEEDGRYLNQCVRWARSHWRGNLIVMAKEHYWYSQHIWTFYAVYLSQFQTPALLTDGLLFFLLRKAMIDLGHVPQAVLSTVFVTWVLFSKIVKLLPHLVRYPQDCMFVPLSIAFSYLHGFINLYALFTTHKTIWGSRGIVGEGNVEEKVGIPLGLPQSAARPSLDHRSTQRCF